MDRGRISVVAVLALLLPVMVCVSGDEAKPKAFVDGTGPGWKALGEQDFVNVNCASNTFTWKEGTVTCTGKPVGVISSVNVYTNFELVVEWRHMKHAGNSGVFVWTTPQSLDRLRAGKGNLPDGIEVQVLDLGYEENWEKKKGKKPDWFT